MALNIVETVLAQIGPQVLGKLGELVGQSPDQAKSSIGAAVPAILAGLANAAARPEGADRLASAVRQQDSTMLDDLSGRLGGPDTAEIADQGSSLLNGILGPGASALSSVIGRFTGTGEGGANALLGALTPAILGSLSKAAPAGDTGASSIANVLAVQKQNIAAALPQGLGDMLGASGLLDGLGGVSGLAEAGLTSIRTETSGAVNAGRAAASAASERLSNAGEHVEAAANHAGDTVRSGGSWLRWALPLLVLLLLAWAAYSFLMRPAATPDAPPVATTTTTPATPANPVDTTALTLGGVDLGEQFTTSFDGLRTTLEGITDTASAQAALPRLQELQQGLDAAATSAEQLPAAGKSALASLIATARPALQAAIDRVAALPGVAPLIQPVVDAINTRLDALSAA